jgi:hypothetical protein
LKENKARNKNMINFPFIEPTFQTRTHQLAICQTIYDANVFDIKNWKNGFRVNPDMLPETIIKFLSLLDELDVDYCIVGGIAYLAYIEDRNTKDLDILISVKELEKILPFVEVTDQDSNFTNAEFEGLKIDFFKPSNALFNHVKERERTEYEFVEGIYPIATISGLILMRFDALVDLYQKGRWQKIPRYKADLQYLTRNYQIDWKYIWKVSEKFFTKGQISEFKRMATEWRKPFRNPFS